MLILKIKRLINTDFRIIPYLYTIQTASVFILVIGNLIKDFCHENVDSYYVISNNFFMFSNDIV